MPSGMENQRIGVLAELSAQMYFIEEGYEIYTSIMTQSKCDFISVKDSEVIKVQVKKATENSVKNNTYLQVRLQGRPTPYGGPRVYTENDFDVLCVIYKENVWVFPFSEVSERTSMTFGRLLDDGSIIGATRFGNHSDDFKVR